MSETTYYHLGLDDNNDGKTDMVMQDGYLEDTIDRNTINVDVVITDKRLIDGTIEFPKYATDYSAGLDLRACLEEEYMIAPGETKLVSTGLRIHLNTPDYAAILAPRSGLGVKNGIVLANLVGVVDGDYTGPLMVALWNRGSTPYRVFVGEKIAQMLIVPVAQATFNIRDEHIPSGRGDGGFGSTGAM